jgi:hypothetical protein
MELLASIGALALQPYGICNLPLVDSTFNVTESSCRGSLSTVLTVPAVVVPFVSGPAIAAGGFLLLYEFDKFGVVLHLITHFAAIGTNIARLAAVNAAIAS